MGIYPKEKVLELELLLLRQADEKIRARKWHKEAKGLRSASGIAAKLVLPEPFVRRYAWERRLDCFPGHAARNSIWIAAYSVVYLGFSVSRASQELGFTARSIENYLHHNGWQRHTLWGHAPRKNLVISMPYREGDWDVTRKIPGYLSKGTIDRIRYTYFNRSSRRRYVRKTQSAEVGHGSEVGKRGTLQGGSSEAGSEGRVGTRSEGGHGNGGA